MNEPGYTIDPTLCKLPLKTPLHTPLKQELLMMQFCDFL